MGYKGRDNVFRRANIEQLSPIGGIARKLSYFSHSLYMRISIISRSVPVL